jgi:perosamine synthetase
MKFIPISQPSIAEKEIAYVTDAVKSGWVSSLGKYIDMFEEKFASYCDIKYVVATSNGTTALHHALVALGITADDEVIIPDLTFVATASAVKYIGAKVVTVDIDEDTLCISPEAIEKAITPKTKAIIPVHLYGHPANMKEINNIAEKYNLFVVEDAAEAHGAEVNGKKVGSLSDAGVFSFYGNKIITSGESEFAKMQVYDIVINNHPLNVERNIKADAFTSKLMFSEKSIFERIVNKLKRFIK